MKQQDMTISSKIQSILLQSSYFHEFSSFLTPQTNFNHQNEHYLLLASYYISRKIQNLCSSQIADHSFHLNQSFQNVKHLIFNSQENKVIFTFLNQSFQQKKRKQRKDRKTSFFRTILKHLKQVFCKELKKNSNSNGEVIRELQEKLSKNTISNNDINELLSKYGAQILNYLQSPKVYKDILLVNKSKANKAYYFLHLKEISIEAKNGRLIEYPFFLKNSLAKQIERICQSYFSQCKSINQKGQPQSQKQRKLSISTSQPQTEHYHEELYCVLNLESMERECQQSFKLFEILNEQRLKTKKVL